MRPFDEWVYCEMCNDTHGSLDKSRRETDRFCIVVETKVIQLLLHTSVSVDFGVSAQLDKTVGRRNTFIGTPYWYA